MNAQPPAPAPVAGASGGDAGLVSGEAVALDVRAARIGSRVLALLLDLVTQAGIAVGLVVCLSAAVAAFPAGLADAALSSALQTVGAILVLVGYPTLWERFAGGRTPGKMVVGLRVVRVDGGPVGLRQSLTRALVGVAVEWPGLVLPLLSWVASVAVMLTDRRGRRLGDLVAGTMVVHTRVATAWRPAPLLAPALAGWAYALDLTRLDDDLALAVRQYVTRAHRFAEPARSRLAGALWAEVAAVTTPPPPADVPQGVCLATVLAERHRRATHRLHRARARTATLWPQLAPAPAAGGPRAAGASH
ncbi:RDD family protein [Micromonospora rubida]|uniref:RDD family protein n=1 Tax=Micromonospora rubida TaxID=2697657 RepID=A0ABW7SCW0_9ACTN